MKLLATSSGNSASKQGDLHDSSRRTQAHTSLQSKGKTARFGSLLLALAHPVVTRKSLAHPQEEVFSSKRAGKLLWD